MNSPLCRSAEVRNVRTMRIRFKQALVLQLRHAAATTRESPAQRAGRTAAHGPHPLKTREPRAGSRNSGELMVGASWRGG